MHSAATDRARGVSPLNIKQLCEKANNSASLWEDWRKKGANRQSDGAVELLSVLLCVPLCSQVFALLLLLLISMQKKGRWRVPLQAACMLNHPSATSCPWCQTHILPLEPCLCVWMSLLHCVSMWSSRRLFDRMLYYVVFNKELRMFFFEENWEWIWNFQIIQSYAMMLGLLS